MRELDFDLKISGTGGQYRAEVLRSPGGEGQVEFNLPFGPDKLENLLLRLTHLRRATRRIDSPELADLPLQILGMVSSPSDYRPLRVQEEQARLEAALGPLADRGTTGSGKSS